MNRLWRQAARHRLRNQRNHENRRRAYIPDELTAAQRAFNGIPSIGPFVPDSPQVNHCMAGNAMQSFEETIYSEAQKLNETGFDKMMDALKDHKLSLGELKEIMKEQKK